MAVNHGLRLPSFPTAAALSAETRPRDVAAALARPEQLRRKQRARGDLAGPLFERADCDAPPLPLSTSMPACAAGGGAGAQEMLNSARTVAPSASSSGIH